MSAVFLPLLLVAGLSCSSDNVNQADLSDCALADFNRANVSLNRQWAMTMRVFEAESSENAQRLRAAQRAWIAFRDAECDAEHPWDLGVSLDKMMNISCRTTMTIDRTHKLAELARGN